MKYLILLLFAMGCTQDHVGKSLNRDCTSYNLDKRIFRESDTLTYKIFVHQFVSASDSLSLDSLQYVLDSVTKALNKEKIYFKVIGTEVGLYFKNFNIKDTGDLLPIKRATVTNFEEFTFMDKSNCINIYIVPTKDNDFLGGVGDFIPDVHCAIQLAAFASNSTPHELMHALGCLHTFEPDITDGYNDEYGDLVCDTPSADKFGKYVDKFCSYVLPNKTKEESDVLIKNVMSNSPQECRCTITKGQGKRIKKNTQVNKYLYYALEKNN